MSVSVSGDVAYIAGDHSGVYSVDITDLTNPTVLDSVDTPDRASQVSIAGDHAYVADRSGGLLVVDISDPTALVIAGSYNGTIANDVVVSGDEAFVVGQSGLTVLDVTNPTLPTLVTTLATSTTAWGVAIAGRYAFAAVSTAGLDVLQIRDHADIGLVGSINVPSAASVVVAGNLAFVSSSDSVMVVDATDVALPQFIGSYVAGGFPQAAAISGDLFFVIADSCLEIVDISDPATPALIGTYGFPTPPGDVAIAGSPRGSLRLQTDTV